MSASHKKAQEDKAIQCDNKPTKKDKPKTLLEVIAISTRILLAQERAKKESKQH